LTEDDQAEKKVCLRKQRTRQECQIKIRNDAVPTTSSYECPLPLPTLPEVSDDNDASAGDSPDQLDSVKSEGDGWDDHPNDLPESRDINFYFVPIVLAIEGDIEAEG